MTCSGEATSVAAFHDESTPLCFSEVSIQRLLAPIGVTLALFAPATASAYTLLIQTHAGMSGNVQETPACATHFGTRGTDRVVTCRSRVSKAIVRFDFVVPNETNGVAYQVNHGSLSTYGAVAKTITRINATHVRVAVRLAGLSRVDIANVAIEYYH